MALLDRFKRKPKALKSIPFSGGSSDYWPLGFVSPNQDITFSKAGAAAAYTMVYEVNACIQSIVSGIGMLDWNIVHYPDGVRKGETGDPIANRMDLLPRHPLSEALLRFEDENDMGFMDVMVTDYLLYGEFYVEKVENVFGSNKSLEWLNPLGVQVDHHSGAIDSFRYGWNMVYVNLEPERVAYLHNRNPNSDFVGLPTALTVLDEINIARNLDRWLRDYFINNARPGMIITPLSEETIWSVEDHQRMLNIVREQLKGAGGQYNTMVVRHPVQATAFEQPDIAKNLQLNTQQSQNIFDAFGVPQAMRGNTNTSPYKTDDGLIQRFYLDRVIPLAHVFQRYINLKIMPFFDLEGMTILEFDTSPYDTVTDADMLEAQVTSIQLRDGIIDLYDAAAKQELEPPEKLRGIYRIGELFVPLDEIQDLWEKQLLVAPSPFGAEEITGKPLPEPTAPEEVIPTPEGGVPVVEGEARDVAIEAEAAAEEEEAQAGELVEGVGETDETKSAPDLLPHFKLYEGEYLFPAEEVIDARLARELHAWKRFEVERFGANPRKKRTREFETEIIPPWVRFEIIDRLDECKRKSEIVNAFDTVMDAPHIKTITSYQRGIRELARGLWNNSVSRGQYEVGMENLIEREFRSAFVSGVQRGGMAVADLEDSERQELDDLIENEKGFVSQLADYIYRNRKDVGKLQSVRSRVDLWVARYMMVKETGYLVASGDKALIWKWDVRKEHCVSCAALNGQVRRASFWRNSGVIPKSWQLACHGFRCGCVLTDTDQRISRGRLPRVGLHS